MTDPRLKSIARAIYTEMGDDPEMARRLYLNGHLDLLSPDDLEWARSVTDPKDRPECDKLKGDTT